MTDVRATNGGAGQRSSAGPTLAAAALGFFVLTLDTQVVTVAMPVIGTELNGDITALQWVVSGYTLMLAALLLSAGSLSDRIGASKAFAIGLAAFTVASAACSVAPELGVLVAARFLQGAAGAVVLPASLALVRQAYPTAAARPRAVAGGAGGRGQACGRRGVDRRRRCGDGRRPTCRRVADQHARLAVGVLCQPPDRA